MYVYNNRRVIGCRLKHSASRGFLATAQLSCLTSNAIISRERLRDHDVIIWVTERVDS